MKNIGILLLCLYVVFVLITAIMNILIGKGRIKNPKYDDDKKREYIYKKGVASLLIALPAGIFLFLIAYIVLFIK